MFLYSLQAKNGFTFLLIVGGKKLKEYISWHKKIVWKSSFRATLKFYWNIATPIHLCINYGCFHTNKAKLNCCNRDHTSPKLEIFAIRPLIPVPTSRPRYPLYNPHDPFLLSFLLLLPLPGIRTLSRLSQILGSFSASVLLQGRSITFADSMSSCKLPSTGCSLKLKSFSRCPRPRLRFKFPVGSAPKTK